MAPARSRSRRCSRQQRAVSASPIPSWFRKGVGSHSWSDFTWLLRGAIGDAAVRGSGLGETDSGFDEVDSGLGEVDSGTDSRA